MDSLPLKTFYKKKYRVYPGWAPDQDISIQGSFSVTSCQDTDTEDGRSIDPEEASSLENRLNHEHHKESVLEIPGAGPKTPPDVEDHAMTKDSLDFQSFNSIKPSMAEESNAHEEKDRHRQSPDPDQSSVENVVRVVPTTDDQSMMVWTFRTWVLGIIACVLITFLNTFFSYRAEPIVITITTALIATSSIGHFMAATLPHTTLHIPGTPKSWRFSLNPGPFKIKEHTLITIFASAGSLRPGGIFVVNAITIFFKTKFHFLTGVLFVLTTELLAYSFSGLMYKFLVEPAEMWWPASLVNVSIVRALHQEKREFKGLSRLQFFYMCLVGSFAYYVLPGFLFPSLSSISILCYMYPTNVLAQQLGSGLKGFGIGAFSFDWASIAAFLGSPLVAPPFAVANVLLGFLLQTYVVMPFTYFNNKYQAKTFPLFSTNIYNSSGNLYDVKRILSQGSDNLVVSNVGISIEGPVYTSIFFAISCGFTFALFGATISHVLINYGRKIVTRTQATFGLKKEVQDIHTRLMEAYPPIPMFWYLCLFISSMGIAIIALEMFNDELQMRWWGLLLACVVIMVLLLPIGILVATTNQQPNLAIMSQYLMGYVAPGQPIANVVFRTYSTVLCGRTMTYLSNFKLGHYIKVPPRATFIAQLIGTIIATLTSMSVSWWLKASVSDICDIDNLPPNTPWTCPQDRVFYDQTIIWGLVGPQRMFGTNGPYMSLNLFMLFGFLSPIVVWIIYKTFPKSLWLRHVNMPVILQGAAPMPPASVVNNSSWIVVASFFSFFILSHHKGWWHRYNYILSAALDAGTALMGVLINYTLDGRSLQWWGNGVSCPLASCPTAPNIRVPGCPLFNR